MRRLRPKDHRPENGPCATHIGHVKSKSTWAMRMASTKSRTRTMASCHLVEARHASTWVIKMVKALVWFWLIDETLSANLVYQSDYEIGSTTPSDEAMTKIMTW